MPAFFNRKGFIGRLLSSSSFFEYDNSIWKMVEHKLEQDRGSNLSDE